MIVHSYDLEEARHAVSEVFVNHRLLPRPGGEIRPIRVSYKKLDALSLCFFDYGRGVEIQPDCFEDFYLLQIPSRGSVNVSCQGHEIGSKAGEATLLPLDIELAMQWTDDARQTIVRIDRAQLRRCLEHCLDQHLTVSPRFDLNMCWSSERMAPVRHALSTLSSLINSMPDRPGRNLAVSAAEQTLMYSLLMLQPHNYSAAIAAGRLSLACPHSVRKVEEYVDAHLAEPITITDLVQVSGVSARTLFESFRRFRDMSPMRFVRHRRLLRVHEELMAGDENSSVTDVAMKWGFNHLGRLAGDYAQHFGECPSETLNKARHRLS